MPVLSRALSGACLLLLLPAAAQAQTSAEQITVTADRAPQTGPAAIASITADDAALSVNAVNSEDLLKYLPDILVRKRHAGDTQDPPETRTSGIGQSARSLVYADGILLSSPLGNNNGTASPHWSLVDPADLARVDVLYGPFAARYPGNSIGAVILLTTHMPEGFETRFRALGGVQSFDQYATRGDYGSAQAEAEIGDRDGAFSWRFSLDHLDTQSQPLAFVTLARSAVPGGAAAPVTGAIADVNRSGAPIAVIGAGGLEHQLQDTATAKFAYDVTPQARLSYTASLFHQDDDARAQSYLHDAAGQPVYSGTVSIGGNAYAIPASAFSSNVYDWGQTYLAQGLSLTAHNSAWDWGGIVSRYDYLSDDQRVPGAALPAAMLGGAGSIARMTGTAWTTFDLNGGWHDDSDALRFGLHRDVATLDLAKFNTTDWQDGTAGMLAAASKGRTAINALWLEDAWQFAPDWKATLGARLEDWHAYAGLNYSVAPALNVAQPSLSAQAVSPKAALAWQFAQDWTLTASYGAAYRMPTVTELYQTVTTGPTLSVPNPDLKPEHANSYDLSAAEEDKDGTWRASLFDEELTNALVSQSAPLAGSTTLVSYVQNIDRVRTRGGEIAATRKAPFFPDLDLGGSVTYVDSTTRRDSAFAAADGKQTPQLPRWRAALFVTWHASDRLSMTLAGRLASRMFATIDNSDPVSHTFQGFDGYAVLDARLRYAVTDTWAVSFGADNLTNDKYFLYHPFPQRSFSLQLDYAP